MFFSFSFVFSIFLVFGAAFQIPKLNDTLQIVHEICAEENEAPTAITDEVNDAYGCFYACVVKELGMLINGTVLVSENIENHTEIQQCINKKTESDEKCHMGLVAQKCMVEFTPKKSS